MTKAEWIEKVPEIARYPKILRELPERFLEQMSRCGHDARLILLRERHQTNHGYNLPKGWRRGGVEARKEQIQRDAGEYIRGRTMADWMSMFARTPIEQIVRPARKMRPVSEKRIAAIARQIRRSA